MKRTTIFLTEELHEQLRREAFSQRLSMAELIRKRLSRASRSPRRRAKDVLAQVEGIVHDGGLSQDIDAALYSR